MGMGRRVERAEVEKWLNACADILRRQPDIVEACRQLGIDPEAVRLEVAAPPPVDGFVEGGLFKSALDGLAGEPDPSPHPGDFTPNVVALSDATDPLGINADPMLSSRTGFMAPGPQDEE